MKRCPPLTLSLLLAAAACTRQPPPHTADDSSWVRPQTAVASPAEPAEKAADLKQALNEQPNPWAPPKTSDAVVPTSMNKPPPATEAAGTGAPPPVPNSMPQPEPL